MKQKDPMSWPSGRRRLTIANYPVLLGLLAGVLAAALLILIYELSMRLSLTASQRVIDDVLGAVIIGFMVFYFTRMRLRHLTEHLNTIALMNHHIRNALLIIRFAGSRQPESRQTIAIEDAINRIDWALREVLPGHVTTLDEGWKPGLRPNPFAAETADRPR